MFNILFFAILLVINNADCEKKPIVETTNGKISGQAFNTLLKKVTYYGFMGIPFAEPPLGSLKFMDPKPIAPWEGILSTTKVKPACIQFNQHVKKGQPYGMYGSEDCLYLDIFTPGVDEKKRAVIVFIFNEHFYNSYNKTKDYAPDFFVEEDIVIVTISHRLSAFGFLSLENDLLPGNAGLKDIVMGLEWISDNIEYFGGDSKRITMMGLQGGAAAIDLLMHSKAKSLFHSAILQSGTSWTTAYLQKDVRGRAFKLGEMMKIPSTDDKHLIEELRDIPTLDIASRDVHASPDDYYKENQHSVISFAPIVEKQPNGLITEYPEDSNTIIDIPVMLGYNSREGLDSAMQYLTDLRYLIYLNKDFPLILPIRKKFAFDPRKDVFMEAIEEVKSFYLPSGKINLKIVSDIITMMGDILINYAMDYTARVYSERSSKPVYYYYFDYVSELNENKNAIMNLSTTEDGTWGAATGDEMCYLFKCPKLKNIYLKYQENNPEEMRFQKKILKLWTNFAKYGNPTPDNDDGLLSRKWPAYTIDKKECLQIGKDLKIISDINKKRYDFWDNFIDKWEKRAVDGIITDSVKEKDEL